MIEMRKQEAALISFYSLHLRVVCISSEFVHNSYT
jgi:hypothetical protein